MSLPRAPYVAPPLYSPAPASASPPAPTPLERDLKRLIQLQETMVHHLAIIMEQLGNIEGTVARRKRVLIWPRDTGFLQWLADKGQVVGMEFGRWGVVKDMEVTEEVQGKVWLFDTPSEGDVFVSVAGANFKVND